MKFLRPIFFLLAACILLTHVANLHAELVKVRHVEGVTLGFLVLRNVQGEALAYGELKQVVNPDGVVIDDLHFRFKDGSYYQEITKFTQRREFRLISDQVVQKGPSFKQDSESWIDAASGNITVRTTHQGKEKVTTKHLDLPPDVSNGLVDTLVKNIEPSAPETTVSMVATSTSPRVIELHIRPAPEKNVRVGTLTYKAQHYVVKVKMKGMAGVIAPMLGKQPPDTQIWIAKSEAPTFIESEGPLSQDTPLWRIETVAPQPDAPKSASEP